MEIAITKQENQIQQWKPTKNNYVEIYKQLDSIIIANSNITISTHHDACIVEDTNQLTSLLIKSEIGIDKTNCHKLLELMVIEVFEWFGNDIKIQLIQALAKTIYSSYYWLKIAEMKLFVERMKAGYYGKVFGKLSPALFMEMLTAFANDSIQIREDNAIRLADAERVHERKDYERTLSERRKDAQAMHEIKVDLFKKNIQEQQKQNNE